MKRTIFGILMGIILIQSCKYNSEEELYGMIICETENVRYTADILPILQNNGCIGCHNASNPLGGVVIDTYDALKIWIENQRLLGSIRHDAGFSAMPQGAPRISQCSIDKITAWIQAGYPNN